MNITTKQWFQIVSGFVATLITSAALLNPLFGQELALKIVAGLGIVNLLLNSVGTVLSGQANLVKDVAAMPGIQSISVNAQANQTLASVAMDPKVDKVAATPQAVDRVIATAKGEPANA